MIYLKSVLQNLTIMGMVRNQSLFNGKFLVASFFIALNSALNWAFLIIEAQTFLEYTNSIFMTLTTTMIAACFAIVSCKVTKLFVLLKFAEELTENRE